jgi:RNA polymerase sigma-70 factor (ECF subfamily)
MAKSNTRAASDQTLVDRASGRDREAFGELYDQYVMSVCEHMYCLVNDRQLAEDLTAQTFLQALQACSQAGTRGW